ncbi:helix-turn-helix transcriptional regulator [Cumulibacter manganitolerans]|uniref:helix-turn-helix transcriptional regulator n=1 Tax=Cumulibacter manganitolerans TaxID=1884992 RepID=UPI001296A4D2|nr:helix-turn-helix domain-containing protein [Cumulibacter manganitolerans]
MKIDPGTGPAPTPTRSLPPLSPQRLEMLNRLAAQPGDRSVDELAGASGLHPNTVRAHLEGLVDEGLVERTAGRTGQRGRPSWRYRVVPERTAGAPEYVGLAIALAEQLAAMTPDAGRIARTAGERWASSIPGSGGTTEDVVALLDDLGFAPVRHGGDIRLTRCPLLTAARRNPDVVCGVHEGLIRARLDGGESGRLEPFAGPGYCTWHGTPEEPTS